ncbi:hypothetical protein L7F22_054783 [Adiantum nelumboides]|nr:hypothetical protein [Adiantum nelumboides]
MVKLNERRFAEQDIMNTSVCLKQGKEGFGDGTALLKSLGKEHGIKVLAWKPGQREAILLLSKEGKLRLGSFREQHLKVVAEDVEAVDWSPDGEYFCYITKDKHLHICNSELSCCSGSKLPQEMFSKAKDEGLDAYVDTLKWARSDSILVSCVANVMDDEEECWIFVLAANAGSITKDLHNSKVVSFEGFFTTMDSSILPSETGPFTLANYIQPWELLITTSRRCVDDHITLLGWFKERGDSEVYKFEFVDDRYTPRIELQEYEESEEAERLDSESSDDSEYAPASDEHTREDQDQANEDSPSSSRGTCATGKISTSLISRPSNALSDNPIQVVFHLNPPKHALIEVFSRQQLSQLGLQSLAHVDLLSNIVTPGKLGAMLLTFPKLNNKILNVEHLGRAMGIKNMPIPIPASKTYSRLTPRETTAACDELLSDSHPEFQRHQKIFHILHYYFLMRVRVVNSLSLPSPRVYDMFFCLCHSLPYPFHVTLFKAIQNRMKRFKTQRKGKVEKFHCYAAPIMQWMAQLISELDTPGSSQSPATDKGRRQLSGRGVQTRGGHSKRTKVSRDSAADLSSLPFSQSHDTRSLRTQTSSHISPTPITTATGPTMVSSAPQPTPQMTSPIGTVGPAPSTIVHHTGLTAATTISIEPSTSTPTPRTSVPQGITHFMSRVDKLLQMERSATLSIADAINTLHGAQKMHAVTYESMYEELLDTHQRVYDRDVEKAAFFDRNRILNRHVKDLKEVISSLN